jgi:drug/metabolite transporter superfamily protein YnfA
MSPRDIAGEARAGRLWSYIRMSKLASVLLLFVAALLEAGGDWLVRKGIHTLSWQRVAWFAVGAVVLFVYGWTVNRPPWNFGELLGLYVVFFFVAAQGISYFLLHEPLRGAVVAGGLLIMSGGLVIFLSK